MKKLIFFVAIAAVSGLGIFFSAYATKNHNPISKKLIEAEKLPNPIERAKFDIEKGKLQFLYYVAASSFLNNKLRDSLANRLGLKYTAYKGAVNAEKVAYVEQYNNTISKHLSEKYGADWEQCLDMAQKRHFAQYHIQPYSYEELSNKFLSQDLMLFFEQNRVELDDLNKKVLTVLAKSYPTALKFKEKPVNIVIQAYYDIAEKPSMAEQRAKNTAQALQKMGMASSKIKIGMVKSATEPDCSKCPLKIEGYSQRVELRLE